ncbi:hypothetical protein CNR22_05515 [Sphingobacteriaceae bacterium]|nr:hypothetical protein CNR22_05515 [Sphingobacteriaceae bacterium]
MLANKDILFGKYLSGNATHEEEKKIKEWLKQDPSHQAEFDSVEKFWKASLHLKKEKDADVNQAWDQFKHLTETQPEIKVTKVNYSWFRIAAAVTLFLVMGIVVKVYFVSSKSATTPVLANNSANKAVEAPVEINEPDFNSITLDSLASSKTKTKPLAKTSAKFKFPSQTSDAVVTVITGDSMEIFMLPDNSIVYLNANSKLEYPQNFNKSNRYVSLTGEAYFDVKKDSVLFMVACENTLVKGRSTTFNVKSHSSDKEVEVIVATGAVEFSGVGYKDVKKLVLAPGESGYYNKTKSEILKSKHERKNYKWWQKESLRAKIKNFFDKLFGKK